MAGTTYPRRYRLGLIEAGMIAYFPKNVTPKYPRRYRLGLIEADDFPVRLPPLTRYPRRYRLGLIEATGEPTP